jgi:hypothetical protein
MGQEPTHRLAVVPLWKQFAARVVEARGNIDCYLEQPERKMRKYLTTAVLLGGTLIASAALAQPSVNGPSGTGPEGSKAGTSITGSGQNGPGTAMTRHGSSKMTKHHETKKQQNKM